MPVSGYDPDDLDETLAERLDERDLDSFMTPGQRREYEAGESLVDVLDQEQIHRLLG